MARVLQVPGDVCQMRWGSDSSSGLNLNSIVCQVFETLDANGDGILTRAEMIKGLKSSSDVSQFAVVSITEVC